MLPSSFEEVHLRLYCKLESYNNDEKKVALLEEAFEEWVKNENKGKKCNRNLFSQISSS